MGSATHYKALMRKNWILWKRNLCVSIIELACPLILFGLIIVIRGLIDTKNEEAQNFLYDGGAMYVPQQEYAFFMPDAAHSFVEFSRQLTEKEKQMKQ